MKVAYERVSTTQQSALRQQMMMEQHQIEKVFSEKISGKDRNRPELQKILDFVRECDTVAIESISRLARSTRDFLNILAELEAKHVALVSLKEQIDTSTPTGCFMVNVFAALAQKAKGIYTGGRPKAKVDDARFNLLVRR